MARLPDSIEVSVKDLPEVVAKLERAQALEVSHAVLVTGVLEALEFLDKIRPSGYHVENAYNTLCAALGEPEANR